MNTRKKMIWMVPFCLTLLFGDFQRQAQADSPAKGKESAALTTYKRFANAFMTGAFDLALTLSIGPAQETVKRKILLVERKEVVIQPLLEPQFLVVSEDRKNRGKEVAIHAVQVLQVSGEEGMFQPPDLHRQFLTLIRRGDTWKVRDFRDDKEKCCLP